MAEPGTATGPVAGSNEAARGAIASASERRRLEDDLEPLGEKTPGGAGTHTGHAGTRITQTNLTTIPTHQRTHTHDRTTNGSAAARYL